MAQDAFANEVHSSAPHSAATPSAVKRRPAPLDKRGPIAAVVAVVTFALYTATAKPAHPGATLPWTLNPTGYLGLYSFFFFYVISIPAKEVATVLFNFLGTYIFAFRRMDGESSNKLEVLEKIDITYLVFNTIVEFVGMNHIAAFLLNADTERRMVNIGILNGPIAFLLLMCVNDIIYYPFHCVAHKRVFYPFVHKQHHRQFVPFRGYYDAANQNPIEQMYGFAIFVASSHITLKITGLHAGTSWICTLAWAIFNITNHLPFDSNLHLPLPYPAYPRDHQMHHRIPTCNYSTLTTMCDRFWGSYKQFKLLGDASGKTQPKPWYQNRELFHTDDADYAKEAPPSRPEAFPSAWSVTGTFFALVIAVIFVEMYYVGGLPAAKSYFHFFKVAIVAANLALMCAATESAARGPRKMKWKRQDGRPTGVQEALNLNSKDAGSSGPLTNQSVDKKIFKESPEPEKAKPFKRE